MKYPKLTFLINSLSSGGAEKVMSIILTELVKKSYNIELICLEKNNFYNIPKKVKITYLSTSNGKENSIKKMLSILYLAWKLKKHIKQNNISLIQSHIYRANYVNILSKLLGSNHKVQIVNAGRISRYLEQGLLGKVNLFLIKYLYKKADLIIVKSKGMLDDMQKLFDFKNQIKIINNPYDIKEIENLAKEDINDFIFDKKKIYLISVGRLIKLKRNHDIIKVLSHLDKKIELIFLGDGDQKEYLQNLSKKLNVENRVHFLGQVKNPYKYIARSNIFISCSESEGFPNVLVEAMICKTPVISSDCISGPREILGDNQYGLLFDVGDKVKLLKYIKMLYNNNDLKNFYIEKAKKRSIKYSKEKIIKKYKEVLVDENNSYNP